MTINMKELFTISVEVGKPIVVGQDSVTGRRQLIPIISGEVTGVDIEGDSFCGEVLPGGVDSQIIRTDGKCELSARYAVRLENGQSLYIENNGIRNVPKEYVQDVLQGRFVDPSLYYFATTPTFEVYCEELEWLTHHVLVCKAIREEEAVKITYFIIE